MDHDETGRLVGEINSDPMARIVLVLTDALHNQAALAGDDPVTAKLISGSILNAIHAFTDADNHDALTLLRALRNEGPPVRLNWKRLPFQLAGHGGGEARLAAPACSAGRSRRRHSCRNSTRSWLSFGMTAPNSMPRASATLRAICAR
jgi:hypothetical protein